MSDFDIIVNVAIVESNNSVNTGPEKINDGKFSMTISQTDSISIDNCEKAVLRTAYPTIRDAISKHLEEQSKKKSLKKQNRKK